MKNYVSFKDFLQKNFLKNNLSRSSADIIMAIVCFTTKQNKKSAFLSYKTSNIAVYVSVTWPSDRK